MYFSICQLTNGASMRRTLVSNLVILTPISHQLLSAPSPTVCGRPHVQTRIRSPTDFEPQTRTTE